MLYEVITSARYDVMVVIGSDHGGLQLKAVLYEALRQRGLEVRDMGTDNGDSVDYRNNFV